MATGKAAARAIDHKLSGEDRLDRILGTFSYGNEVEIDPRGGGRNDSAHIPVENRKGSFKEVMLGFTSGQAQAESLRCLRCDVKETCVAAH
jgi:hypothetical protein